MILGVGGGRWLNRDEYLPHRIVIRAWHPGRPVTAADSESTNRRTWRTMSFGRSHGAAAAARSVPARARFAHPTDSEKAWESASP